MGQDGFGTLSSRLMERGTERVRAVLDEAGPEPTSVSFDLTYAPRRDTAPRGPHTERAYDVPPATRTPAFARVPPPPGQEKEARPRPSLFGARPRDDRHGEDRPAAPRYENGRFDADRYDRVRHHEHAPRIDRPAAPETAPRPAGMVAGEPRDFGAPATPGPLASSVFDTAARATPFAREADMPAAPTPPIPTPVPTAVPAAVNPVGDQQRTLEARRAGPGGNLTIRQPQAGDMSQVTVTMNSVSVDHVNPQKGGQAPSSVTYERRSLSELAQDAEALANGKPAEPLWIETPSYSGVDRRTMEVSPEIERRKTVPPRIKVGVRLEQERYLRLKLAAMKTGRTQQDIVTCALDAYLDTMSVDRFVRIAMGFGVEADGSELDPDHAPQRATAADGWR